MKMTRYVLSLALGTIFPSTAWAQQNLGVIVGKVEALEPQDVKVGNTNYRIAVVKINEGIKVAKAGQKTLRVGFVPIENLVGRAEFIFFSIDAEAPWWQFWQWPAEIRWSRIGLGIR